MFLNESFAKTDNYDAISESPYELGISGALMHVYENECNYNAIMKAVGEAEFKYYNETGKTDLFLNEAASAKAFIDKIVKFFESIKEKIVAIFKKFLTKINSIVMTDKQFVDKYGKDIKAASNKGFSFQGWDFSGLHDFKETILKPNELSGDVDDYGKAIEEVEESINRRRASIIGAHEPMTSEEFRDAVKEKFYGKDKTDIGQKFTGAQMLDTIASAKKAIDGAKETLEAIKKAINDFIKEAKEMAKKFDNADARNAADADGNKVINNAEKNLNNRVTIWKAYSNDLTVFFGAKVEALKKEKNQAKAFCVKLLANKPEEAKEEAKNESFDIFAGVQMI